MDLDAVTDELYAGGLDDFLPQRTALAKAARAEDDKALAAEIAKLRKPSTSAWAINMLVRSSPKEIDRVLDLGAAFRQAQDDLDGAELRELTRQRQTLITAVIDNVRDVARDLDRPISDAIASEVEQTFRAAMADPDAAAAVRGGALTTAISGSGLGSLKITDVAASTTPVRAPSAKQKSSGRKSKGAADADDDNIQEREREAKAAAEELERAEQAATAAADRITAAGEALERAHARRGELRAALKELREQLARAERDLEAAEDDVADAEDAQEAAKKEASNAEQAVKHARSALP